MKLIKDHFTLKKYLALIKTLNNKILRVLE